MKGKFFIGAAVGFVGGIAAGKWALAEAGYSVTGLKKRLTEIAVQKVLGREYRVVAKEDEYTPKRYFKSGDYINYADYASAPAKPACDLKDKTFELVRIFGKDALLCTDRGVLKHAMMDVGSEEWHEYHLRGSDWDPEAPVVVEKYPVYVNYCGTIVTREPLNFADDATYIELKKGDLQYSSVIVSAESFIKGSYDIYDEAWDDAPYPNEEEEDEDYWDAQFEDENREEGDEEEE